MEIPNTHVKTVHKSPTQEAPRFIQRTKEASREEVLASTQQFFAAVDRQNASIPAGSQLASTEVHERAVVEMPDIPSTTIATTTSIYITVHYVADGRCILDYQQHELIASIDIEDKPQLNMTHSVTIPGRTLAIVCIYNNLDPNQSGSLYKIEPCGILNEMYPNLCVIPMIHNVDVHRTEHLPLVVINFASDEIYL